MKPKHILNIVADYYELEPPKLCGSRGSRRVCKARQIAMAICRELTDMSYTEIAEAFNRKCHTTAMLAERRIKRLSRSDLIIKAEYANLKQLIFHSLNKPL